MRGRPQFVANPRSPKQMEHRTLFKQEVQLAARMRWAIVKGLAPASDQAGMTAYNLFVSLNQEAFALADGELSVAWERLQLSVGPVAPVALGTPTVDDSNVLSVSFEKNPMHLASNAYDHIYLYAYCPDRQGGYLATPAYRREQRFAFVLPDDMRGCELHLYAFALDEQGRPSTTAYVRYTPSESASTEAEDVIETLDEQPVAHPSATPEPVAAIPVAAPDSGGSGSATGADPAQLSLW